MTAFHLQYFVHAGDEDRWIVWTFFFLPFKWITKRKWVISIGKQVYNPLPKWSQVNLFVLRTPREPDKREPLLSDWIRFSKLPSTEDESLMSTHPLSWRKSESDCSATDLNSASYPDSTKPTPTEPRTSHSRVRAHTVPWRQSEPNFCVRLTEISDLEASSKLLGWVVRLDWRIHSRLLCLRSYYGGISQRSTFSRIIITESARGMLRWRYHCSGVGSRVADEQKHEVNYKKLSSHHSQWRKNLWKKLLLCKNYFSMDA